MVSMKYKVTWKSIIFPLIGLAAFFAYIYIFNVDILQIIAIIQSINLYIYLLAAVAVLLDTLFFTLAWRVLLKFLSVKLSIIKSLLFVWFGIFMDILIPAESISGEISRIYLVTKEHNGATGKVTASLVAQRLIGMGINIVTLIVGAVLLLMERQLFGATLNLTLILLTLILIALTFVFLLFLLLLCVKEKWTLRIVGAIIRFGEWISRGHWKLTKLREEVVEAAKAFHGAMREYGHAPKTLFIASSFSIVSWILAVIVFYLSFLSIGYTSISWGAILVICSIFAAAKSVPIGLPFEVGLPEITLTTLFIFVGVPAQTSATVTILVRILTLWFRFIIGFVAQQWLSFKGIAATQKNNKLVMSETEKT
jgi:uncharacterized protein (TIRG00374 family)